MTLKISERQFKMIFEHLVNEYLDSRITKELLLEELHVSESVKSLTDKIYQMVKERREDGVYHINDFGFIGNLKVNVEFIRVLNIEDFVQARKKAICSCDTRNVQIKNNLMCGGILNIKAVRAGSNIDDAVERSIIHEVEHLYQKYEIKKNDLNKNIGQSKTVSRERSDLFYDKVKNGMNNTANPFLSDLSKAFYNINHFEQDAHLNEFYVQVKEVIKKENRFYYLIDNTDLGKTIEFLIYYYRLTENWVENRFLLGAKNYFYNEKITFEQFKANVRKKLLNGINRLERKMKGVYKKVCKEEGLKTIMEHQDPTNLARFLMQIRVDKKKILENEMKMFPRFNSNINEMNVKYIPLTENEKNEILLSNYLLYYDNDILNEFSKISSGKYLTKYGTDSNLHHAIKRFLINSEYDFNFIYHDQGGIYSKSTPETWR
jgi:hypothetical protein